MLAAYDCFGGHISICLILRSGCWAKHQSDKDIVRADHGLLAMPLVRLWIIRANMLR